MAMLPPTLPALRTWTPARNFRVPGQLVQAGGPVGRFPCDRRLGQLDEPLDRDRRAHAQTPGVDADGRQLRNPRDIDQADGLLIGINRPGGVADHQTHTIRTKMPHQASLQLVRLGQRGGPEPMEVRPVEVETLKRHIGVGQTVERNRQGPERTGTG